MPRALRLYRIVQHRPPTDDDFKSSAVAGREKRPRDRRRHTAYDAVSTFDSLVGARQAAADFPRLGNDVAILRVVTRPGVVRVGRRGDGGHREIWGPPAVLRKFVVRIVPSRK
jgi:hypothetical protein